MAENLMVMDRDESVIAGVEVPTMGGCPNAAACFAASKCLMLEGCDAYLPEESNAGPQYAIEA